MDLPGIGPPAHASPAAPPLRAESRPPPCGPYPPPPVRYIRMFNDFFDSASMTSTYKVAFLRSLADVGGYGLSCLIGEEWIGRLGGGSGNRMIMSLDFVAARFAKFYWDMEVGFGLLHISPGSGRRRRPRRLRMTELVRSASEEWAGRTGSQPAGECGMHEHVPRLSELASGSMEGLRARTVSVLCRDVLDATLKDMPGLYEVLPGRRHISFDTGLVYFMREYGPTVKRALNHKLAVLLERLNPEARHIATKTDEAPVGERIAAAGSLAALQLRAAGTG